jgi:DNA modification methylase/endonuclease YncB( thermonuclease family)
MQTTHTIINGDCRKMYLLNDKSVHLIITSPPYWQLKDYGSDDQIGFNDSYETYINHLNLVWKECFRVLKDGCRLCVNIGDQFARSVYYGRYKVIPIHSEIIRFCESIGFDFMGQIIWQKATTMNTTGGGAVMGSFPYPRNGIVKLDFEYILLFKKQGIAPKPTKEQKENAAMTNEEWNTYFNGHWYFNGTKQDKHLAMFPLELPKRLIKMFSFPGEWVLDPFMGSGTTALAARRLQRNSVGYEINPDFIPLIKDKIGVDEIGDTVNVNLIKQEKVDSLADINSLPYKFVDVHKIDKKVDVKQLQYGSKIDSKAKAMREDFYSVREVLSPELVKLNNGLIVRLIGIKTDSQKTKQSVDYLMNMFKGKRVYLRYDAQKYDSDNHLCAYIYLSNRTFVNAHIIKDGMADVDNTIDFKYKEKFNTII